jgi:hypothetical protein
VFGGAIGGSGGVEFLARALGDYIVHGGEEMRALDERPKHGQSLDIASVGEMEVSFGTSADIRESWARSRPFFILQ